MYDRAYEYLKDSHSEGATAEEKREGLIQILGEDWIGFWAILDQILFYEGMIDELSTLNDTTNAGSGGQSQGSEYSEEVIGRRRGVEEAIGSAKQDHRGGVMGVGGPLNEDSDLDLDENMEKG